jgi:aryl-alcohol dehydrogenase-like predicted oxidoreductase
MQNRSRPVPSSSPGVDPSLLRASEAGTAEYCSRFRDRYVPDYFRATPFRLDVSSIGIGSYLGNATTVDDEDYRSAIRHAISSGINLIDTAINYRGQRSERVIGAVLQQVIASGEARREELVLCSKAGYIPLEPNPPATRADYQAYVKREFVDQQILRSEEIVAGGHSLAPRFVRYCLAMSRQNLGVRTIDVYYVHNPEQQLASVPRGDLLQRLRAAFAVLEEACSRGEVGVYGCATWDAFRVPPDHQSHLALEELVGLARDVAGDDHHFRVVQLPVNLAAPEAIQAATQPLLGRRATALEAATDLGLTVIASATLMQAKLTHGLPDALHEAFPRCTSDAQRAIEFVRSMPGVTSALVGMKRVEHVEENLGAVRLSER